MKSRTGQMLLMNRLVAMFTMDSIELEKERNKTISRDTFIEDDFGGAPLSDSYKSKKTKKEAIEQIGSYYDSITAEIINGAEMIKDESLVDNELIISYATGISLIKTEYENLSDYLSELDEDRIKKQEEANERYVKNLVHTNEMAIETTRDAIYDISIKSFEDEEKIRQNIQDSMSLELAWTEEQYSRKMITIEDYERSIYEIKKKYRDMDLQNESRALQQRNQMLTAVYGTMANTVIAFAQAFDASNKTMFEISKWTNVAQATMNAWTAYTEALKSPPPVNFMLAKANLALGLSAAAVIATTQYGGKSSRGSGGAGEVFSYRGFNTSGNATGQQDVIYSPMNTSNMQTAAGFQNTTQSFVFKDESLGNIVAKGTLVNQRSGNSDLKYWKE